MTKKLTSVIDVPRKAGQADLFGIDKYKTALVKFIETTSTPITVAIQGEWGSGKTSLMNTLKDELCDQDGKSFYPIWLNTWQFSLMKSEEETLIAIINGLTNELADIAGEKDSSLGKLAKKSLGILGKIAGASVKVAVNATTGQNVGEVVDALSGDARDTTILKLRDSLNELITKIIEQSDKGGFIFFIDDLDRIDPPVAVNILELLKNIFDLDNCVFVLAIDYDVVVKGLEPKFGKLTEKNEREFRSFFDKIIQLPFSMPVSSYNIDVFLKSTLEGIDYVPKDLGDKEFYKNITEIAYNSVGSNPRSLKRLVNTLSLISIINAETGIDKDQSDIDKQINFALVCLQVAYPSIYKAVNMEPNYTEWNEDMAIKLKLRKLEDYEAEKLKQSEEFDEEWEQVLYRICERDTYLEARAFNISLLLNKIAEIAPIEEGAVLGDYITVLLELSSVTDVQAFDKPRAINNRAEAMGNTFKDLEGLLPSMLISPFTNVKLPKAGSNLNKSQAIYFYGDKSSDWLNMFNVLITPKAGQIVLSSQRSNIISSSNINPLENEEIMQRINNTDDALSQICDDYGFEYIPFGPKVKINRNKTQYRATYKVKKTYKSEEELSNKEEMKSLSEFIVKFSHTKFEMMNKYFDVDYKMYLE